jgi:PAS domain S-box-containing protein
MKIPSTFSTTFGPPIFDDPERSRTAWLVHGVLVGTIVLVLPLAALVPVFNPSPLPVLKLAAALIAAAILGLLVVRRGALRAVCVGFTLFVWFVMAFATAVDGGLRAPAMLGFPVVILLAGFFLGRRAAVGLAVTTALGALALLWPEVHGMLPADPIPLGLLWLAAAASLAGVVLFVHFALRLDEDRRDAERRLRRALQAAQIGTWEWDVTGGGITWSTNAERLFGLRRRSFGGTYQAYIDLIHPQDRERVEARLQQALDRASRFEVEHRIERPDGSVRWLASRGEVTEFEAGRSVRMAGMVLDITERHVAEERLLRQVERNQAILSSTADGFAVLRPDGQLVEVNDALCQMLGYLRDELLGMNAAQLDAQMTPGDIERTLEESQRSSLGFETTARRKDGSIFDIDVSTVMLSAEDGPAIAAFVRDISARKDAEAALRESEERYRVLFENSPAGIGVVGPDGGIRAFNRAMLEPGGYTPEDIRRLESVDELYADPEARVRTLTKFQRDGFVRGEEVRFRASDGGTYDAVMNLNSVTFDEEPCLIAHVENVTERKRTEEALRQSEERYRRLADNAPAIIYRLRLGDDPGFDYISPGVEPVSGYTPEEFYEDPGLGVRIIHPDDRPGLDALVRGVLPESPHAVRWIRKDGTMVWTEDRAVPVYDDGGALVAVEGVALDITQRMQAEERLKQSEERYRTLLERLPYAVYRSTPDGRFLDANPALVGMLGYDSDAELKTLDIRSQVYAEPAARDKVLRDAVDGGLAEIRLRRKDGSLLWAEDRTVPVLDDDGEVMCYEGTLQDITDRKRSEEQLRASEATFRAVFEGAGIGMAAVDLDGHILSCNAALAELLGYERAVLVGMNVADVSHPDDQDRDLALKQEMVEDGRDVGAMDKRYVRKDGSIIWGRLTISLVRDPTGEVQFVIGMVEDVTERRAAERALRASEQRLAKTFGLSPDAIAITKASDGRLVEVNDTFVRLSGYSREEAIGRDTVSLGIWERQDDRSAWIDRLSVEGSASAEMPLFDRRGMRHDCLVSAAVIDLHGDPHILSYVTDITERKRAEEGIRERAALAAFTADVTGALITGKPLRDILHHCAEAMVQHLDAAFARIWTLNEAQDVLELQASAGMYAHLDGDHARIRVGELKIGRIAEERQPHLTNAVRSDPLVHDHAWAVREGLVAFAGYPLIVDDELVGVAAMFARDPLTDATLQALGSVVNSIASAIERKRAEEARQAGEARRRAIFEQAAVGIIESALDGRFLRTNAKFCEIVGYSVEELAGLSFQEITHPDDLRQDRENLERVLRGESGTFTVEKRYLHKNGSPVWTQLTASLIRDPGGEAEYWVGVVQDITDRRSAEAALRRSEERYRTMVERLPAGVYRSTHGGKFLEINPAMVQMLGYEGKEELLAIDIPSTLYVDPEDRDLPIAMGRQAKSEVRLRRKDGSVIWVEDHATYIYDDTGNVRYHEGVLLDITVRRQAEESIRASEERFRTVFESAAIGVAVVEKSGVAVESNAALQEMLGYSKDELGSMPFTEFTHPDDAQKDLALYQELMAGRRESYHMEKRYIRKDGPVVWGQLTVSLVRDAAGAPRHAIGMVQDVTERRRAEDALRDREDRMRQALIAASAGAWEWDIKTNEVFWSDENFRLFGLDPAAGPASYERWLQCLHADDRRMTERHVVEAIGRVSDLNTEYRVVWPDGSVRWINGVGSIRLDAAGKPAAMYGIQIDITERKRATEALRASEEAHRVITENSMEVMTRVNREGRLVFVNRAAAAGMGTTTTDPVGLHLSDVYAPEIADEMLARIDKVFATGEGILSEQEAHIRGERRYFLTSNQPIRDSQGRIDSVMSIGVDITERLKAEDLLKRSEAQYRAIAEDMPALVCRFRADGELTFVNGAYCEYYERTPEDLVSRNFFAFVAPEDRPSVRARFTALTRENPVITYERRTRGPDGSTRWQLWTDRAIVDDAGRSVEFQCLGRDITESRIAEARVRKSEQQLRRLAARLQAVREEERTTIAREIHDELGQALTGIKIDLAWIVERFPSNWKRVRERGKSMFSLVDSAINTVRDLSARLRPAVLDDLGLAAAVEWQAYDVANRTGLDLVVTTPSEDVELDREQATALFRILQEALTNVVRHAEATKVAVELRRAGNGVVLEVTDDGRGIAEDVAELSGSLGLLGMQERAVVLGGDVRVQRIPEGGTKMTATVPLGPSNSEEV